MREYGGDMHFKALKLKLEAIQFQSLRYYAKATV